MTLATLLRKLRSVLLTQALNRRLGSQRSDPRRFAELASTRILGRPAQGPELDPLVALLEAGTPRRIIVERLLLTVFAETLHALRCDLVRQLPAAAVIVDLGGASGLAPEGALLSMGYPHRPREITIVDLPPEADRAGAGWTAFGPTRVRYLHQSMTDLTAIASDSVDLVWAGQSLEHVSLAEAEQTLREGLRVLRPGGWFCLDTPNRALTRLQSPRALIHPGHQVEYTVSQLTSLLTAAGLTAVTVRGLGPLPRSARWHVFQPGELRRGTGLSERPEECYVLSAQGTKPVSPG